MNQIIIHKADQEGAFHIDALTGQITTPTDERPEWAEGYAVALLGERTGWYEQRLGQQLPDNIRKPAMIDASDLGWIALLVSGLIISAAFISICVGLQRDPLLHRLPIAVVGAHPPPRCRVARARRRTGQRAAQPTAGRPCAYSIGLDAVRPCSLWPRLVTSLQPIAGSVRPWEPGPDMTAPSP